MIEHRPLYCPLCGTCMRMYGNAYLQICNGCGALYRQLDYFDDLALSLESRNHPTDKGQTSDVWKAQQEMRP